MGSTTTAFKKTHIKSPPKDSQKKIETNQSDPTQTRNKRKAKKKSKSSPIQIMVGRQIIIIITTLSLCMCLCHAVFNARFGNADTSVEASTGLVCSFFGQQQLHQHPKSLLQRSSCLHATETTRRVVRISAVLLDVASPAWVTGRFVLVHLQCPIGSEYEI